MLGGAIPVIVTFETELTHGEFEIVHAKTLAPLPKPPIAVLGKVGEIIVPLPETNVHNPLPTKGVLPAITAPELVHTVWFGPAADGVGRPLVVMVMFEVEDVQGGLLIDQVRTVVPGVNPVTVEFGKREFVITPGPETFIQAPVPATAGLPANVTEPMLAQIV